jgi:hypothetical protein
MPATEEVIEVVYAVTVRHTGEDGCTPNPGTSEIAKWIQDGMTGGEFGRCIEVEVERF